MIHRKLRAAGPEVSVIRLGCMGMSDFYGPAMFLTAPIAGRLMTKADPRFMLAAGFLSFAVGSWWMTYLTSDWDFWELVWPQIFRGVGLMTAMIPINNVALGTLPPDRVKNAFGLYNLTRNLGGAVGLAGLTTILNDRSDLHLARLHEKLTFASRPAVDALDNLTANLQSYGSSDAQGMALKQLMQITHTQGVVMAFADVFFLLTCSSRLRRWPWWSRSLPDSRR